MKKRFKKTKTGYIFDRYIFITAEILILIYFGLLVVLNGFDFSNKLYVKCDSPPKCFNPLYHQCKYEWCYQEILPYGFEFGEKPTPFFNYFLPFSIMILIISFIANHLKYNKGGKVNEMRFNNSPN